MSCQQVSKPLVDDPYIFTETTIVSPPFKKLKSSNASSYLNSQINKVTPYISSPIPVNEIKLSTQQNLSGKITTHFNNTITHQRKNGHAAVAVSTLKKIPATTPAKIQKQIVNGSVSSALTTLKTSTPQSKFGLTNSIKPVLKPTHPVQFQTAKLIPSTIKTTTPNVSKTNTIQLHSTVTTNSSSSSSNCHQKSYSSPIPAKIIVSPPKNNNNTLSAAASLTTTTSAVSPAVSSLNVASEQSENPPKLLTASREKVVFLTPAKREYINTSTAAVATQSPSQVSPTVIERKRKSSIPKEWSFGDKRTEQSTSNEAKQRITNASKAVGLTRSNWHSPASHFLDSASSKNSLCVQAEREEERQNMLINAENLTLVQYHWLGIDDMPSTATNISREQRIELRKAQLRRQANQLINARPFQTPHNSRKRLIYISKIINQLKHERKPSTKKCSIPSCKHNSLALTQFCYVHITRNMDQKLFLPCTAKFSDNSQCRVPVFDISHELPLCKEHAWKRDNYNRIIQEQKPKKPLRKRFNSSGKMYESVSSGRMGSLIQGMSKRGRTLGSTNSAKRKRKSNSVSSSSSYPSSIRKLSTLTTSSSLNANSSSTPTTNSQNLILSNNHNNKKEVPAITTTNLAKNHIHNPLPPLSSSSSLSSSNSNHMGDETIMDNDFQFMTIDGGFISSGIGPSSGAVSGTGGSANSGGVFGITETSSQYESSEDTGVGGLSETEFLSNGVMEDCDIDDEPVPHDVIEAIPLSDTKLLEHDLANVLNQLPEDAFNELFTAVQQEEQEFVEKELERANQTVKSLQEMTGDDTFLGDFDLDESDICFNSSDTSGIGIDASHLFVDSGTGATNPSDIRGLLRT